jgi:Zn-dependent peptidase ImmA (M78 family)
MEAISMLEGQFNGQRLREARRYNKKTIGEIAEMLNVTKQMVSKYENGKASPNMEAVLGLVRELGFPRDFYYSKSKFTLTSQGTFFRSFLTSTQKDKNPAEYLKRYSAIIRNYLDEYLDFPSLEWNLTGKDFSPEMYANYVREEWGLGDNPIISMMELLENHGFVVARVNMNSQKVDALGGSVKIDDQRYYVILLEGDHYSFYRQQFSLAHELGHWLLHNGVYNPQEVDKGLYKEMEKQANEFASAFLMPKKAFKRSITVNPDQIEYYLNLKRIWNVSIGSMLIRARDVGVLSPDEYTSLQRKLSYRGWRKEEPLDNVKFTASPVALKQGVELLVENNIVAGYDIPREISIKYGIALPTNLIEELAGVKEGYLQYKEPKIVQFKDLKLRNENDND